MERFEKVATPLEAATVVVPESVPEPGLVPIATVTLADELVTVLRTAAWSVAWTAGLMATPAVALGGWTEKASLLAAPGLMLIPLEVAPVSPLDEAARV